LFTKGNTLYVLCSLVVLAGILASVAGSWFDGS
jgi:hypothetical protein